MAAVVALVVAFCVVAGLPSEAWAGRVGDGKPAAPPSPGLKRVLDYIEGQLDRYDKDLSELVAFPSVSALPDHTPHVLAAADWVAARLRRAGLQGVEILPTNGSHPVVYGEWLSVGTAAPTVLLYGHYDVQPVDPLDEWESPPFEVSKRGGYYYGRGVDDDKGGLLEAVQAVEAWLQAEGSLPVNVKVMLEGEEEVMSPHLPAFLRAHAARLAADVVLSADGGQPGPEVGGISLGLRGVVGMQVHVETAGTDMHSGMKGGSVPNANHVLAALVAGLRNANGGVAVEGFYDDVAPLTDEDRADVAEYHFDADQEKESLGLYGFTGEKEYGVLEQRWFRPTLDVVGMWGGFTGEGIKTVIPRAAHAKISCRLVPAQTPEGVLAKVSEHIARHCPAHARCRVIPMGGSCHPWTNPRRTAANDAAAAVHRTVSAKEPIYLRDGASIPALTFFQQELGLAVTKFGWGLSERIHAPNERLRADMYGKGRRAWALILEELARRQAEAAGVREEL
ncbi:hypothetical protein HYH03_018368 [Edaphochlamys debaryana]|uniref:Peptidase M20 dimerisation domain-containing protein n=1 Tax=Edaphochlamys debaryana TaxID=47281 RepID=A0A836BN01_9CHLO|nr:hypothetical protein HYH03_018368 [Edaphochlamys debaryana]|eukprot:KAG2482711.1 hypothetical protein HYH03_018368 [Edaphochlamys debaryana]